MNMSLSITVGVVRALFKRSTQKQLVWSRISHWLGSIEDKSKKPVGQVTLIGAGPGDPELLTLKALRLMREADVVLYDWLVSDDILTLIPKTVETLFVGKRAGKHSMQQSDICDLLCEHALAGKKVVRLKGGDPAIFGRLGEECLALEQRGIAFAIVPGVTAASGISAYTGTPLTDRRCSQSVRLITAQFKKTELEPDWASMTPCKGERSKETLVFYMGLSRVALICQRLMEYGLAGDTPAMLVDQATTSQQTEWISTVSGLPKKMTTLCIQGPALLVIGEVIGCQHSVDLSLLAYSHSHV